MDLSDAGIEPGVFARVLDALPDAIVIVDTNAKLRYGNRSLRKLTGWDIGALIANGAAGLVHPADVFHLRALVGLQLSGVPRVPPAEFRVRHSDGRWIAVEASGVGGTFEGDAVIVACLRDISHRVGADEIRFQHDFLLTLLREARVGIMACDAEGRILTFNDVLRPVPLPPGEGEQLSDWHEKQNLLLADGVTPMSVDESPMSRALKGERVKDLEYAVATAEGTVRHRRANALPLVDAAGRQLGAVVALQDITEQRRAEQALRRQALYDHLTDLPNRALLQDRLAGALARCRREKSDLALFFLDLDNFKVVNDGLGHSMGDRVLVQVAERLRAALRPEDTVARLGGDEFVAFCEGVTGVEQIMTIADRMRRAVDIPVIVGRHDMRVTASIGVVMSQPEGDSAERLLRDADTAMYLAKDRGRDRWEIFDDTLRARVVKRMEAEQALRRAIKERNLVLHFQPVVDAKTRTLASVEALVRYRDSAGNLVQPGDFIGVAEQAGLIGQVDRWVLKQACTYARHWARSAGGAKLTVCCNVSAATIGREDFVELIETSAARAGIELDQLCLELTETAFMSAGPATINALAQLRTQGLQLGIDDFGTGYSSLTYLRELPVSFVKIDRSFVDGLGKNPEDTAIVETVIRLAHALGLKVTAEGVENRRQEAVLRKLGCDSLQGFLFARPCSPSEVGRMIENGWPAAA